jgi:hypothetical protein
MLVQAVACYVLQGDLTRLVSTTHQQRSGVDMVQEVDASWRYSRA